MIFLSYDKFWKQQSLCRGDNVCPRAGNPVEVVENEQRGGFRHTYCVSNITKNMLSCHVKLPFIPDGRYVWNLCGVGPVPKQISTWQHDGDIFISRLFLQNSNISYWEYHWKSLAFLNSNSKVIQSIQLSKVEGLTATPIWEMEKTGQEEHLGKIIHKDNWNTIR